MRVLTWRSRDVACRDAVALFTDYLEGAIRGRRRAALEGHLRVCPDCSRYLEQLRETVRLLGRVEPADVPEPAMDALLEVFRRFRSEEAGDL